MRRHVATGCIAALGVAVGLGLTWFVTSDGSESRSDRRCVPLAVTVRDTGTYSASGHRLDYELHGTDTATPSRGWFDGDRYVGWSEEEDSAVICRR
jgi:hypothetical protein